ncbi:aldolase catalytic domain-containing protein [Roseomonas populi]|uniref:Aldolase catalytic domain-containing protein n=1 Tax=Roseomonas populi TaxID=3121582 RepID=A0ABT1X1M0_9PROT|nr:aldolase catalytic domain-containing protein [Roseomonas pecuniae]MCR0982001.1 aldolase catalytic domain-containing protein [Roseomonas pecuniae]
MVQVLDCTFRDGGYYTSWDFDPRLVDTYMNSIARLPIDYVEVGYVNDRLSGYYGEYFFLTADKLTALKARLRPDQKLLVMIDAKAVEPERVPALFGPLADILDMVRIACAPAHLPHGLSLARELKKLGLQVGFNVMYLSTFKDNLDHIRLAIESPDAYDALSLVDSYGGVTPNDVSRLFKELRARMPDFTIGFHGHDNMCLAFANTLAAIEAGADVVDGTFTGMGRGAGNAKTETILIHLAREGLNAQLDHQALSTVVAPFEAMQREQGWGTNLPYMISGANNLPQKDVMDWLAKNRYSVMSIVQALQRQGGQEVDKSVFPDVSTLGLTSGDVLLIGGGPSVKRHVEAISRLVAQHDPVVVFSSARHLDLAARIGGRQLLCLPGHDAFRAPPEALERVAAVVIPAPPRVPGCLPEGLNLHVVQAQSYETDEGHLGPVSDNSPLALALGTALALGAKRCFLVGFDGYDMASAAEQELSREVQAVLDSFAAHPSGVALSSLTPTRYRVKQGSIHGLIAEVA